VGAMQPRFHYLGSAVLAVILCLMISEAMRFTLFPSRGCYALLFGWIAAAVTVRLAFGQPIDHHERARRETEAVLSSINSAIRMTPRGGDVYVKNRRFKAGTPLTADPVLFPGWAGLFVVTHPSNTAEGRRIHFGTHAVDSAHYSPQRAARSWAARRQRDRRRLESSCGGAPHLL
jgi:hypothetical protein